MARLLRYAATSAGPLTENRAHGFAARFALAIYEPRAIYSLIPKNGCSTLRYALARTNGAIAGPDHIDWIHENTHSFAADLRDLATAAYSFVILRCPFRRLASAFLDKIVGRYPPFWRLFSQTDTPDPEAVTFRQMVERLTRPGGLRTDVHWRPQADFLVYQDYDDWFRLEDMSQAQATLKAKIGLDLVDTRPLLGHDQTRYAPAQGGPFTDTTLAELHALRRAGRAPDYRQLYDTATATQVARAYAEDIALYAGRFGVSELMFPNLAGKVLVHQESSS